MRPRPLPRPQVELVRRDYVANSSWETFLSYEDPAQDILIGLLRLRRCSPDTFRAELKGGVSIVRELHVYPGAVFHFTQSCLLEKGGREGRGVM